MIETGRIGELIDAHRQIYEVLRGRNQEQLDVIIRKTYLLQLLPDVWNAILMLLKIFPARKPNYTLSEETANMLIVMYPNVEFLLLQKLVAPSVLCSSENQN